MYSTLTQTTPLLANANKKTIFGFFLVYVNEPMGGGSFGDSHMCLRTRACAHTHTHTHIHTHQFHSRSAVLPIWLHRLLTPPQSLCLCRCRMELGVQLGFFSVPRASGTDFRAAAVHCVQVGEAAGYWHLVAPDNGIVGNFQKE